MLQKIEKAKGAANKRGCGLQPRYEDLGLEKTQAHRWQKMAAVPEATVWELEANLDAERARPPFGFLN